MSHDPLCPFVEWPDESCYQQDAGVSICAVIAKVREDEMLTMEAPQLYYKKGYEQAKYDIRLALPDAYDEGFSAGYEQGVKSRPFVPPVNHALAITPDDSRKNWEKL